MGAKMLEIPTSNFQEFGQKKLFHRSTEYAQSI